ncbi:MAG: ATP-binding cassette domain-containing protein [Alphaproteobacteria bacterium]|nr:ATP-binding cassette domain-containing protein [Alphaproteobacteria bacterium]
MSILPLTLKGAEVFGGGRRVLGPVDHSVCGGGATVLLGPNGAGKTTFLKSCHGIVRLSVGSSEWAVPTGEANLRQAYVFQTPILLRRTVLDNVSYPLMVRGASRRAARNTASRHLADVGLEELADQRASVLSGGEKQKLSIARALVTDPEVLFLDEPTASLDGRSTREIEAILLAARDRGKKLLMATHDLGQARRIGSEILFLLNGKIHETGPADKFFAGPATAEASAFLKGDIVE